MSFKDRKRDDHGHVIGNDEVDGQECKHQSGGSSKQPKIKEFSSENEAKEYLNKNADKLPDNTVQYGNKVYFDAFDDDYEEEFASFPDDDLEEDYRDSYERNAKVEGGTTFEGEFDFGDKEQTKNIYEKSKNKVFKNEYISDDPIFKVVGITDDGYGIVLKNSKGESWDVPAQLAETGGVGFEEVKDTPERKLAGAVKGSVKEDDLGKIQSKNNPQLTGEKILHEGWKRNIPQDKIAIAISKELGVSLEDAKEYVEKESKLPEAIDFDEWIENSKKSQPMKAPINKVSMSALPKHHFNNKGHLVIDEGEYKGEYTNEKEFWNDVNASNPQVVYKDWDKMTPDEQKTTKIQAKNVFDDLNDKYYNENIKAKPSKQHINLLKKFLSNEKLNNDEFEQVIGILERNVK